MLDHNHSLSRSINASINLGAHYDGAAEIQLFALHNNDNNNIDNHNNITQDRHVMKLGGFENTKCNIQLSKNTAVACASHDLESYA